VRNSRRGNQSLAQRFARNLLKRRKELALTQADLAERLGVANETLSRFERARHLPSLKMLERMAGALRMPIADLLGDAASAPEVELDQSRLTAALDGLGRSRPRTRHRNGRTFESATTPAAQKTLTAGAGLR
jgi:transcriptional regulator with XRE-family HTH domain